MAERGFRLTGPRKAVLDVLLDQAAPLSAAEIHGRLANRRVNLVSVYRAVHLMLDLGVLRVADASKGTQRFELAEEFTGHHHHLVCRVCGSVEDLDGCVVADDLLAALSRRIRRARKFRVLDHDLRLFGLCAHCNTT